MKKLSKSPYVPTPLPMGQGSAREERVVQIIAALLLNEAENPDEGTQWFGTYELARACGMKPSSHFRSILRFCYNDGVLLNNPSRARSGVYKDIWALSSAAQYKSPYAALLREFWMEVQL